MEKKLQEIASHFALEGGIAVIDSLGEGFINDTFIIRTEGEAPDYILQRKNKNIFPDVPAMMDNIRRVTDHIRRGVIAAGGDPRREVMTVVPTREDALYHIDGDGEYWAVSVFIDDTVAYNKADSPELARKGGEGIGKFQAQLADFTEPLAETIKGFHNIRHRFVQWDEALKRDAAGRKKELSEEIGWIESRRGEMLGFWSKVEEGTIPTRVTHNDTKINNILFGLHVAQRLRLRHPLLRQHGRPGRPRPFARRAVTRNVPGLHRGLPLAAGQTAHRLRNRPSGFLGPIHHLRTGPAFPDGLHRRRHLL